MKVEIWSDVMCPFCYIGKRKFEAALEQFAHKEAVEVVWKSFQLNPAMETQPDRNISEYLAETKGWTVGYARQMNDYVTQMAAEVGLHYDFDKAVVANSFDAHRLVQLAKKYGKGDAMEERLFKAYFTEGLNTADHATLLKLGTDIGLDADEVKQVLTSDQYTGEVKRDISESRQIGVTGVPFFVFNHKYAVSGAQAPETFLGALNKSFGEWEAASNPAEAVTLDGPACTPDGECA
ncbi:putative DsbA family dithiol-disulfide isomerase [Larkinella arboricola]|uniref:Putative DsbA family dithiol-disulfide isomerase n=1 Tax=Larkinella arboricola TaxID=643671 RepID=A0A327X137_LARAB|nr:DsbA family oxidoreductase [Larkinella arboricola]RAK00086.1 putative DsbA family dithiol-disulfide isomerase [Larkinella arboricola]